jgi:hypothetical protein
MKRLALIAALTGCGGESKPAEPTVKAAKQPVWCSSGMPCVTAPSECASYGIPNCKEFTSYACFTFESVTSGSRAAECWATFSECNARIASVKNDAEVKSIDGQCSVFRLGAK